MRIEYHYCIDQNYFGYGVVMVKICGTPAWCDTAVRGSSGLNEFVKRRMSKSGGLGCVLSSSGLVVHAVIFSERWRSAAFTPHYLPYEHSFSKHSCCIIDLILASSADKLWVFSPVQNFSPASDSVLPSRCCFWLFTVWWQHLLSSSGRREHEEMLTGGMRRATLTSTKKNQLKYFSGFKTCGAYLACLASDMTSFWSGGDKLLFTWHRLFMNMIVTRLMSEQNRKLVTHCKILSWAGSKQLFVSGGDMLHCRWCQHDVIWKRQGRAETTRRLRPMWGKKST